LAFVIWTWQWSADSFSATKYNFAASMVHCCWTGSSQLHQIGNIGWGMHLTADLSSGRFNWPLLEEVSISNVK
jgi:hypothetical protein